MDARSDMAHRAVSISMVCDGKRHKLNKSEFRSLYYLIHKIGVTLNSIANRLALEPGILEMLMHCMPYLQPNNVDVKMIARILNLDHCKYIENNNSIVMTVGTVEYVVPLANVVADIKAYIMPDMGPLAFDKIGLELSTKFTDYYNNESMTITGIYHVFKEIDGLFTTSRMKGLGQMPKPVLRQTCLDRSERSFVTVTSLGDVEHLYRVLGVDTQARKDLVSQYVDGESDDFLF